jgi:hypothetical protein
MDIPRGRAWRSGGRWACCWPARRSLRCQPGCIYPLLGVAFFPRTDAGQFVINLKASSGYAPRSHLRGGSARGGTDPRRIVAPEDLASLSPTSASRRVLVDLHQQLGPTHGVRSGEPQARPQDRQLRVHEPRSGRRSASDAAPERILPVRRAGRRRAEPRPARADRRAGQRLGPSRESHRDRRELASEIRSMGSAMSTSRRTSTTRPCGSKWTAPDAPASWD